MSMTLSGDISQALADGNVVGVADGEPEQVWLPPGHQVKSLRFRQGPAAPGIRPGPVKND
jgi:hypothetical protein